MNAALPLPAILADAAQAGDPVGVPAALCIVLGAGLLILARAQVGLRSRIEELERRLAASAALERREPEPAAAPSPASVASPASPAPAAPPASAAAIPPAHLVIIAAAVHHLFKGRARLASIRNASAIPPAHGPAHAPIDWAREGRRDIFTSHKVR